MQLWINLIFVGDTDRSRAALPPVLPSARRRGEGPGDGRYCGGQKGGGGAEGWFSAPLVCCVQIKRGPLSVKRSTGSRAPTIERRVVREQGNWRRGRHSDRPPGWRAGTRDGGDGRRQKCRQKEGLGVSGCWIETAKVSDNKTCAI